MSRCWSRAGCRVLVQPAPDQPRMRPVPVRPACDWNLREGTGHGVVNSGPRSPLTNSVDRSVGEEDAAVMGPPTEDGLGSCFRVVLGRRGLPRVAGEPFGRGGETLGGEERRAEFLMFGAGELNVVSELVSQIVGQIRGGPGDTNHQCRRRRVVLGTGVEFPCCAHVDRTDAVHASRVRSEESIPRVDRDRPEVIGNGYIELKHGTGIRTGEYERRGHRSHRGRGDHHEDQYTTHRASLPTIGSGRRNRTKIQDRRRRVRRATR